jgi:ABC-2 type transport system permease protein
MVALTGSARRAAAEPGPVLVSVLFYALVVAVLTGVWRFAAGANDGDIVGYSAVALTWYIATSESVTLSLNARMIEELGTDIAEGTVSVELLRPVSVLWLRVATQLGRAVPRLAVILPVGVGISALVAGAPLDPAALALAGPSILLALVANTLAQHAFAASAFWLRSSGTAWYLYQKLVYVAGGMLIPLEVFPGWLQAVTRLLPFRAMAYAPARLAAGHVEPELLLEQAAWVVALALLAAWAFRAGEARLQVVGG